MNRVERYWGVVPAAGAGRRMGATLPKQYLPLAGRQVIDHSLQPLLDHPRIEGVVVALSPQDSCWAKSAFASDPRVRQVAGGRERCHSVMRALQALRQKANDDDWVLVHDAARPCLRGEDIDRLIEQLSDDPVGGILAVPVHDTVKSADHEMRVSDTLPRERLWRAFTPQMFRLSRLVEALRQALAAGLVVTDEASAMEYAGLAPKLVQGHGDNIKITRPQDLELAAFYLHQQATRRQGAEQ